MKIWEKEIISIQKSSCILLILIPVFAGCGTKRGDSSKINVPGGNFKPDTIKNQKSSSYWKLVIDDEFNSKGGGDTDKWGFCPRSKPAWAKYLTSSSDYAHLDGDNLVLRMDGKKIAGDNVPYHSGGVCSKFSFKYGKVKVKAKFRQGQGSWPAIWMMPEKPVYGTWPKSGEIDIMKHINNQSIVHQTVHNAAVTTNSSSSATHATGFSVGNYNLYGIVWTVNSLKFYVNGILQYTYSKPANATHKNWPYDQPFYLILNQSGGAGWPGKIDDKDLPFVMKVDWVKVYKKEKSREK